MTSTDILVVEGDAAFRRELIAAICAMKPTAIVHEAGSAEAAIFKLSQHPIGLAIVDIALPGTSGLELVMYLRARGNTLSVILLSMQEDEKVNCVAELLSVSNVVCKSLAFYQVPKLLPGLLL